MSHKKLQNYSNIFLREDFTFISDQRKIKYLFDVIRNQVNSRGDVLVIQSLVNVYLKHLKSFYDWLNVKDVPDIDQGYQEVLETLLTVVNTAKGVRNRDVFVTSQILRRLKRNFIGGLSKIKRGLDIIFTEGLLVKCNVEPIQIVRYIINRKIGLGDRYRFNTSGRHAFVRKAQALIKNDVIDLLDFLRHPGEPKKTKRNGWMRYGLKQDPFRIPFVPAVGRKKVYALFITDGEHRDYERFVDRNSPSNVNFRDAA